MQQYTINFFYWYIVDILAAYASYCWYQFIYFLILTKAWPMLANIYRPLFGDKTNVGLIIGIFIRFFWGLGGLIISLVLIVPYLLVLLFLIILPIIPVVEIVLFVRK